MATEKDSDVGRTMAALEVSSLGYRSFAAPLTGSRSPENMASRVAAFPLLAAALPELAQIDAIPASLVTEAGRPVVAEPEFRAATAAAPAMPSQRPVNAQASHATQFAALPPFATTEGYKQPFPHQTEPDLPRWQSSFVQPTARVTAQGEVLAKPAHPNAATAPEYYRPAHAYPSNAKNVAATPLTGVFHALRGGDNPPAPTRREAHSELQDMFSSL